MILRLALFFTLAAYAAPCFSAEVRAGIDVLIEDGFREVRNKRIGLITNQTGKTRKGRSTAQVLANAPGVKLKAIFSPEHGFAGTIEEGSVSSGTIRFSTFTDPVPIYSLYGSTDAPISSTLSGLDALVFDIQDVGARFYTYSTTMGLSLEAAAAANMEFIVLDRPNPINGDTMEGPILSPGIRHFTAYFPVPIRHGLTMGELARLHNITRNLGVKLQIVPVKGWTRSMWYDETGLPWTRPSPNMPDLDAATMYPGIAIFESTNLAVGRGTDKPFRWVGAPWLNAKKVLKILRKANLAGVAFHLEDNTPAKSIYKGRKCKGISIRVADRNKVRPTEIFVHLACAIRDVDKKRFKIRWDEIRRMIGSDKFQQLYRSKAGPDAIIKVFRAGASEFESTRNAYLLY